MAQYRLEDLRRIYADDDELGGEEVDIDYAVCVGLERIERMRNREFADYSEFDCEWFGIAAILKLSIKSLTHLDTHYSRSLQGTCSLLEQMRNSVEFVDLQQRGRIHLAT